MHEDAGLVGLISRGSWGSFGGGSGLGEVLRDRWFGAGLLLRLLAVGFLAPQTQAQWFTPFMAGTLWPPRLDPWTSFVVAGGDALAFPYGPVMYALHAPTVLAGMVVDRLAGTGLAWARVGFGLSLLLADLALLAALTVLTRATVGAAPRQVVVAYWWSPIVLFVTYWHGQTDIIPTLFIVLSLLAMQRVRLVWSGGLLGLGIAAKLSAGIAAPFLFLFVWNARNLRAMAGRFALVAVTVAVIVQGPFVVWPGTRTMILASPEIEKIYEIAITLGNGTRIYIVPLLYLLLLFSAARIGRMNFELLFSFLGLSFLLILLCTPASIGWYIWVVPFVAVWQMQGSLAEKALGWGFSLAFVGVKALGGTGAAVPLLGLDFRVPLVVSHPELVDAALMSKGITVLTALGLAMAMAMLSRGLLNNDFYKLSRRPLAIGIAGDSGTGKDTLSAALAELFGETATVSISGDDYHLFERRGAMWQTMTHLDIRANDLRGFTRDMLALRAGRSILARQYDHSTGLFTRRLRRGTNEVVLVSGLHALYPLALREALDVSVFLDMDEELRRHFKLRRDVGERGHQAGRVLAEIERREADFLRYVGPQAEMADLCMGLVPAEAGFSAEAGADAGRTHVPMRLRVRVRHALHADDLARGLIALCGAGVDVSVPAADGSVEMVVDGEDLRAEDLGAVGAWLVPHLEELHPIEPGWRGGLTGVMQLCVLVQLGNNARRR